MVHGVFIRSPVAHAEIVTIDTGVAMDAGALLILTANDLPFIDRKYVARDWHPSIRNGEAPFLATDRVRYVGEPVAFLVAVDRYQAEDLASLCERRISIPHRLPFRRGGTAGGRRTPASGVDREHRGSLHAQRRRCRSGIQRGAPSFDAPIPLCAADSIADRNPRLRGRFRHDCPNAESLDVDPVPLPRCATTWPRSSILVNSAFESSPKTAAGGFRSKSRPYGEEIIVPYASKVLERPVKWIEDRFEHMQATTHSRGVDTEIRVAYDDNGRIDALVERIIVDIGAYVFSSGIVTAEIVAANARGPYRDSQRLGGGPLRRNQQDSSGDVPRGGPARGRRSRWSPCWISLPRTSTFRPLRFRDRNIVRPCDMPYQRFRHCNAPAAFDSGDYPEMLAAAVTGSGYTEEVIEGERGERMAWGLACGVEGSRSGQL